MYQNVHCSSIYNSQDMEAPELLKSSPGSTLWPLPSGYDAYFGSRLLTPINKVHSVPKDRANCAHLISPNSVKALCSVTHSCVGYLRAFSRARNRSRDAAGWVLPHSFLWASHCWGKNRGTAGGRQGPWQQSMVSEPDLVKQSAVGSYIKSARSFRAAKRGRLWVGG